MAMGRSSAMEAMAMLFMLLLLHFDMTHAANYTVGDASGWSFGVSGWPKGKSFRAGDILVFKYNPSFHNVVVVDKASYKACTTPPGAKVYQSGEDNITLGTGNSYFICSFPGHCQANVKIAVKAV